MKVGRAALIDNLVPALNCPLQVLNRPELPIEGRGLGTKQVSRCVFMQSCPKLFYLSFGQPGSVATLSMVFQSRCAALTVLPAPSHQTALAAPSNLSNLLRRVIGAIQSDSQKTSPRRTIFALRMRVAQVLNLLLCQLKLAFSHVHIIQHLTSLSIRTGQRYRFRYLVDGKEWINDWYADDFVENPYGSDDSVVDLTEFGEPPHSSDRSNRR